MNIAHRGYSGKFPENTMVAFKNAVGISDMMEFDVTLSRDRIAVVIHDSTLDRTTNGKGAVREQEYASLAGLDAGGWFAPEFSGERIPRLRDVLSFFAGQGMAMNVEIKEEAMDDLASPDHIENQVVDMIFEYALQDRVLISSFSREILQRIRNISATIRIGVLAKTGEEDYLEFAEGINAESVNLPFSMLGRGVADKVHAANKKVLVWTLDKPEQYQQALALGADGIFTNQPQLLRQFLANQKG